MKQIILNIIGLDCPAEEKLIRNALNGFKTIAELRFNFIQEQLTIFYEDGAISQELLIKAIKKIGMVATSKNKTTSSETTAITTKHNSLFKLIKSKYKVWILATSALFLSLAAEIYSYLSANDSGLLVVLMASTAIILTGLPTLKKGLIALKTMTLNINFLMMLAILGALLIGQFPEASMVTVLFALAELIEKYSLTKARTAIADLMNVTPNSAMVKHGDHWHHKDVAKINLDEIIKVKPGERIALDGIITMGQSLVNQASITGESLAVNKQVGDLVYAGSLNTVGSFEFRVSATEDNTLVAKIVHTVEQAQGQKANTQRFVDQFSKYYTPIMVILAVLIAFIPPLFWQQPFYPWLYKSLVLLVIACPCALVISTPITVVSALSVAATHGILVKGGVYLESAHKLKAIAFDKTGTLTNGTPVVTDVINYGNLQLNLKIAASINFNSEHPLANAIVNHWQEQLMIGDKKNDQFKLQLFTVDNFIAILGRGVSGTIDNINYFLGNHQLAHDNGVCNPQIEQQLNLLEQNAKSTIILWSENKVLAIFAVADQLRANSLNLIDQLKNLHIASYMLTGDNIITAQAIGAQLGINNIHANLLPQNKLSIIGNLIEKYKYVAMVGDGINDAPALAKSTIGFAMGGSGTDIALETADVVLMNNSLLMIPALIKLSHKTIRVLKQNISFAIFTKVIFFALALMGMATLWMAVFADMGASLIVVFYGLSLIKTKME